MPTYDYECSQCGDRFELFQKMTDNPLQECPKCKGKIQRLVGTGAGVIYKGAGFYTTEYRSDSYKKGEKAEKCPADTGGAKKCETCPAGKKQ